MLVSSSLSYDGLDAVPSYGYSCDNIGNRKTAQELASELSYAANRTASFTSRDGATILECGYDRQERRYMKKITVNGTVASHGRNCTRTIYR